MAQDVINPHNITVTFDSIGGLDPVKKALVREGRRQGVSVADAAQYDLVILPLVRPELFERGKLLRPTKVWLLS